MEPELAGLQREMETAGSSHGGSLPVEFHFVGVGPRRAGGAMTEFLSKAKRRPEGVLLLGVAGAVDPDMESGEVILADTYALDTKQDSAADVSPDPEMLQIAEATAAVLRMPVSRSSSLTVDHLIVEGKERQELREKYRVGSVNMEDHAVAVAAQKAGVPFLSVRTVLDTAEQTIPGYLPGLSRGRNAVLTEIMLKPWRIPTLMKLKSQMDLCQSVLTRFGMTYFKLESERRRSAREKASKEAIY
jgi:adenosylhomocysteine nucleosidase